MAGFRLVKNYFWYRKLYTKVSINVNTHKQVDLALLAKKSLFGLEMFKIALKIFDGSTYKLLDIMENN